MTAVRVQTRLIDLAQTDFAPDARTHDPDALATLAHDMGVQGQLQEIIVESKGDRFTVIAGVGRTLAARSLGWTTIRASVRENVSLFDKARITFAENEDREDVDPFYQAAQLDKMLKAKGCRQLELAQELGLSPALVSAYVAIHALPKDISRQFKRLNLGQLIQIARLNNADSKIGIAAICAKNDLSVRQVKALVDRTLKISASGAKRQPPPPLPDPLASVWPPLLGALTPTVYWEVKYGTHRLPDKTPLNGWFFFVSPQVQESSRADVARWCTQMGAALGGTRGQPEEMAEVRQAQQAQKDLVAAINPRIPRTPKEKKELADIAVRQGPPGVYTWIYGADSPMTKMVPARTWKELGMTAEEGLRQILEGLQTVRNLGR